MMRAQVMRVPGREIARLPRGDLDAVSGRDDPASFRHDLRVDLRGGICCDSPLHVEASEYEGDEPKEASQQRVECQAYSQTEVEDDQSQEEQQAVSGKS